MSAFTTKYRYGKLLILNLFAFIFVLKVAYCSQVYSDQFVVEIPGGTEEAIQVARDHGFDYLGQVSISFSVFLSNIIILIKLVVIYWNMATNLSIICIVKLLDRILIDFFKFS